MENIDRNPLSLSESRESNGRESISTESALAVQIDLAKHMVPNKIKEILNKNDDIAVMNELITKWTNRYAKKFAEFCDEEADNEIIQRIQEQNLTEADLDIIKNFLLVESGFFADNEINDFLEKFT